MDMKKLLKQAQQMQQQFQQAQDELADKEFTAQSGGGMVSVTVDGQGQVKDIDIDSEVVDPDDVEMLEDMILTAVENATERPTNTRRKPWATWVCRTAWETWATSWADPNCRCPARGD